MIYPVDNEQIFLPNDIVQQGILRGENENYFPYDPEHEEEGEDSGDDSSTEKNIDINYTSIKYNAVFLADYFIRFVIRQYNVVDLLEAYFYFVKHHVELREESIAILDPAHYINNFVCWYEYDTENTTHEIRFKRTVDPDKYFIIYLHDKSLDSEITESLRPHAIYYANYLEYHIATFACVYALYDYIRNHKDRVVKINDYEVSFDPFEKNTMVVRRKIEI